MHKYLSDVGVERNWIWNTLTQSDRKLENDINVKILYAIK